MTLLRVGITGGIGSGKSLVCRVFKTLGVPVYDADSQARQLMTSDAVLIASIRKEFGEAAYRDGVLDRAYLAREVFHDSDKLAKLNALVHPRVAVDFAHWLSANKEQPYVLKEAALLYESGAYRELDVIIVVTAPEEIRIKRVMQRDHRSEEEVQHILKRQWPESEKVKRADIVLHNDGTALLLPRILELHERFKAGFRK